MVILPISDCISHVHSAGGKERWDEKWMNGLLEYTYENE